MRKKIVVCVITAFCLFVSASPWEGAAATAPEGELPGNGRYIATNSFPRNTIVDIVNIETNKSTRVIVAGNLDSPGLLAIVSREAAELIGMRTGSVSRIRMTQPSDPVAYVRFTEGLSSGIPDYDSGSVISEDANNEEFVNPASAPNRAASGREGAMPPAAAPPPFTAQPDAGYPAYVLEPEWSGAGARNGSYGARDIVDLPPAYSAPEKKPDAPAPVIIDEPEKTAGTAPAETAGNTEKAAGSLPDDSKKIPGYFPEDDYEEVADYYLEDEYYEDDFFIEPDEIADADEIFYDDFEDGYFNKPDAVPEEKTEAKPEKKTEAKPEMTVEYNIVPADNRPPASNNWIDPNLIIPGITRAGEAEIVNNTRIVNDPRVEKGFSIPRKDELSRGSYYVQLAAFDTAESVENSISRIDQNYKQKFQPFVYKDSDQLYHVLLGPLNQGESYAVLQRFKSIGYKDAFVKLAR